MMENNVDRQLEHKTVYLKLEDSQDFEEYLQTCRTDNHIYGEANFYYYKDFFIKNPFSDCTLHQQKGQNSWITVTTNLRVIKENNLEFLESYVVEPDNTCEKRRTIKMTINLEFLQYLLNYRLMSITYNYLPHTYLIPESMDLITTGDGNDKDILKLCNDKLHVKMLPEDEKQYFIFLRSLVQSDMIDISLFDDPDVVNHIASQSLAVEVIMTGFDYDWEELLRKTDDLKGYADFKAILNEIKITLTALKYTDNA